MSEDEVMCNNCGSLNDKNSKYCIDCGKALGVPLITPSEYRGTSGRKKHKKKRKKKSKLKFQYKVLIYFGIVIIVNSIISSLVIRGFTLGVDSFTPIFFGTLLLTMIIAAIFWGAAEAGSSSSAEGIGVCGGIVIAGIIAALVIPLWIFTVLPPITGAITDAVGEAITNAIEGIFSNMFADIEIPGFEPFLFISIIMVLSILIIYRFHLSSKK